jgi:hypothetical protein
MSDDRLTRLKEKLTERRVHVTGEWADGVAKTNYVRAMWTAEQWVEEFLREKES